MSYSIYLLHGLILTVVFANDPIRSFALKSPVHHWVVVFFSAVILICASTITYVWIERGGIDIGKRVLAVWEARGLKLHISKSLSPVKEE